MCEQRTALDLIKSQPRCGGLSKAAVLLHERQCKDYEKMEQRMERLEKKFDDLDKKLDLVIAELKQRDSFKSSLRSFFSNKIVQAIIATVICASAGSQMGLAALDFFK